MADAPELSRNARKAIANRRNEVVVSAACLWEIAIKRRKGKLFGVDDYLARHVELHAAWGFTTVVIEPADAVAAGALRFPHDDPFDRMLVVQSRRLGARIVTCDEKIRRHVPGCVW
jgi:PIN domain nuclease of toxin-antitoxin system